MSLNDEDQELFDEIKEKLNSEEIDGFLIVAKFSDGSQSAAYSDIALKLYDDIKEDMEINRKVKSGEWTPEDVEDYIKNKKR